ncbi:helix-turn-helix domain-containing protein [Chroogloeocystis siderophila]|uniref:helix-turn-helix domain-containing protein n=1 Tax=Chroogloeocystis siderophila TaxID=329163 RepID=UPI000937A2B9|nr:AraC family transcriptional regulator [Chroogloeocystis siderophila]
MTLTLLSDEYEQLWQARQEHNIKVCPQQLGCGYIRTLDLRGIELSIFNYQVHEDLNVIFDFLPGDSWLEFGFQLLGNRSGKRAGQNFVTWGTTLESEIWASETLASEQILKVDLGLEPYRHQLKNFVTGDLNRFPKELQQLLEGDPLICYEEISTVTPAMRLAAEQILYCPYTGTTEQIYLESKCLELIALKIEQLAETELSSTSDRILLKSDDIDRIYHARKIIVDNLDNPPSLSELAKQVELNECTLKRGFRQVFHTTVFGYLHQIRMEQAYQLLVAGDANVTEAAKAVGYASTTSFSAAFRKKYGKNPCAYRRSHTEQGNVQ